MPRLTDKAKKMIEDNLYVSSRKLQVKILDELNEDYSHTGINDFKRLIRQNYIIPKGKTSQKPVTIRTETQKTRRPSPKRKKLDFNSFMEKLNKSNAYASVHLKEKLDVQGKHKAINKERVIRIIRDVLDIVNED
jgi:hypothetical protein